MGSIPTRGDEIFVYIYTYIFPFFRSDVTARRWVPHAMPPKYDEKWGTGCTNTRFSLPTLLCAGYCLKLIYLNSTRTYIYKLNFNPPSLNLSKIHILYFLTSKIQNVITVILNFQNSIYSSFKSPIIFFASRCIAHIAEWDAEPSVKTFRLIFETLYVMWRTTLNALFCYWAKKWKFPRVGIEPSTVAFRSDDGFILTFGFKILILLHLNLQLWNKKP